MARSHQQTLLAKMGFGDPDLKLHEHDLACRFLAEPHVFPKLAGSLIDLLNTPRVQVEMTDDHLGWRERYEEAIVKGHGQYATIVGFIDVVIDASIVARSRWYGNDGGEARWHDWEDHPKESPYPFTVGVEVKITPESIGAILRQIAVYREFWRFHEDAVWLLATRFPLSEADVHQLQAARIAHVRLGKLFDEYCIAESARQQTPSTSLEL